MTMFVYILYSASLEKYYTGHTADFTERIRRHNSGLEKYTKTGAPWELIWKIEVLSRSGAKRFLEKN